MSQDTTLPPLPDERAEFEAWADSRQYDLAQYLTLAQPYVDCDTQAAWTAWQARAAIAAQAPQPSPLIAVGEDGEGQENHCPECGAEPGQMCSDEEGTEHGRKVHAVRQAQQAQGVPAPDLIAAAQAVVRDALDAVEVHPCDVNDDSVRAKFLLGSMAALHSALAAAPQAEPVKQVTTKKPDRTGMTYYRNSACKAEGADSVDCICWTPNQAEPQTPAPAPEDQLLREVFALCEATEDAPQHEPKNEHQRGFDLGRRFEAKQIRKAIGTWFQDTFCGAAFMGEPTVQAPAAEAEPQPEREPERKPLTDAQIEKLREQTFSTSNPFCPCDSKTMRKAVWAAERAHGIGTKGGE